VSAASSFSRPSAIFPLTLACRSVEIGVLVQSLPKHDEVTCAPDARNGTAIKANADRRNPGSAFSERISPMKPRSHFLINREWPPRDTSRSFGNREVIPKPASRRSHRVTWPNYRLEASCPRTRLRGSYRLSKSIDVIRRPPSHSGLPVIQTEGVLSAIACYRQSCRSRRANPKARS
jgi:hypothetical protein